MILNSGDSIADYEIVAQIGAGGMATVYQAYHQRLDRYVAIKVMHETFARDETFLERFQREARIVARLEHPHIVPIYDYAEFDNQPYFVMKFIEGGTLKRRLIKRGIALDEVTGMMTLLADALTYAHEKGVLHRDIKPSNMLIDERDLPYISDFGLARIAQVGDSTISHDLMLGTPWYISPEQARGERDLTPSTDVYSFGIILYELLLGQVPFGGDTPYAIVHEHIYTPPTPPSQINPEFGKVVDDVLLKALSKQPSQRYQSATALMDDFKLALANSGIRDLPPDHEQASPVSDPRADSSSRSRRARKGIDRKARKEDVWASAEFRLDDLGEKLDESLRTGANFVAKIADQFSRKRKNAAPPTPEELIRRRIQKKLKARSELFQHLTVYLAVNGMLWMIWAFARGGFPWPIFVSAPWGIGILSQYIDYYYKHGRGADQGEAEVESEITRQMSISGQRKGKPDEYDYDSEDVLEYDDLRARQVRLNDDGELSDSFVEELDQDENRDEERLV